ncbi:TetR/AcrR family transcriptional regulator [Aeromicrobium alkaliterrae]|uniref:TetR/AcrR family transcriptional regulator n=1 Tax=Aeromicrobium alkaliterrae TaxID=302168 RepID=A0ABN2K5J3_9ACTN
MGQVQHYFADRDELLRFAYAEGLARTDARLRQVIDDGEAGRQPIRTILDLALRELLPLDAERSEEMTVALCLQVIALHEPGLAEVSAATERERHARVAAAVANGMHCGEVAADVDPALAASRILATTHGLAARMTRDPATRSEVDAVLPPVLATVFTGRCRHWD